MFLPNKHSFLLASPHTKDFSVGARSVISNPVIQSDRKMFLPNTESFLLTQRPVVKFSFPVFSPNTESFLLTRRPIVRPAPQSTDQEQSKVNDRGKRTFLKVAGVAGAGLIASQLLPKKASALIMGSSPTTGVVGVKDSTNTRINPATEETLDEVLKTGDLTFDAGSLEVKVTSTSGEGSSSFSDSGDVAKSGLVDAQRHVQVDVLESALPASASTEDTLQTISFGGKKYTLLLTPNSGDSNIEYVGEADIGTLTSAASWRIKEMNSTTGVTIKWADGDAGFNNIWDGREGYTYT